MKIKVCVGSNCMFLGSLNILDQIENLNDIILGDNEFYRDEPIEVEAVKCLGLCKVTEDNIAPIVMIDGEPMFRASSQLVMEKILSKMKRN